MPWTFLAVVMLVSGAVLCYIGFRSARGQLPRNRFAGVRTSATMRSDEAFEVGNRAAAPLTIVAGVVAVLGAVSLVLLSQSLAGISLGVGVVLMLGCVIAGGVKGHRAARDVVS